MLYYRIGLNDAVMAPPTFTDPIEAGNYALRCLSGLEDLTECLNPDDIIWKLDVEVTNESGEIVDLILIHEDEE